jgi:flagellar protein FliO/FliZ
MRTLLLTALLVVATSGAPLRAAEPPSPSASSPTAEAAADAVAVASSSPTSSASTAAPAVGDASTPPAPAPSPPPPPAFEDDAPPAALSAGEVVRPMVKTVVALTVVLLLAWLTLHKGMGRLVERAQAGKRLRVVERVALDARRSLFLVEVDGRTMVVGGGDVVRLDSLPTGDAADASLRASAFDKVLASTPSRAPSTTSTTSTAVPTEPA